MKVSFDLDDTAWKYRAFFRELSWCLQSRGHHIGALTGHDDNSRQADLDLWVRRGYAPMDFLLNKSDGLRAGLGDCGGGPSQREWKLALARANGVDAHFDDFGSGAGGTIVFTCLMRDEGAD